MKIIMGAQNIIRSIESNDKEILKNNDDYMHDHYWAVFRIEDKYFINGSSNVNNQEGIEYYHEITKETAHELSDIIKTSKFEETCARIVF